MADPGLYTVGGTVQAHEGGLYLSRPADQELLRLCRDAAFAYVLTPRQLGKSSLMIRTANKLMEDGVRPVTIDLTQIGTQLEAETWYGDFVDQVGFQLDLTTDARSWWKHHADTGHTLRLTRFFQEVVLREVVEPIVIFVDEIDTTLSLAFTDDFFAAIRYLYVARSTNAHLRRLSFVLIGVATPADLIQDPKRTPFNIGERVDLGDFTPAEAAPLAAGLGLPSDQWTEALGWILAWTGGHPYLTQRLCGDLAADPPEIWSRGGVEAAVAKTFFGDRSEQDNNLQFVRDMLTKRAPHPYEQEVLRTYRAVWRAKRPVADEEQNLVHAHLKLSGVVRHQGNALVVRNPIYREVFNAAWIQAHDPESVWQRYGPVLKWAVPLTATSAAVAMVMAVLYLEAEKQRQIAEKQTTIAQQSTRRALVSEHRAQQALLGAQQANQDRLKALNNAEAQRQRAEAQAKLARQQQQRAEGQTAIAQRQTTLAQHQTRRAEQQTAIATLREQVAQVRNLLPTVDALYGMVLAIDAWGMSQFVPEARGASASSLLHALQASRQANLLQGHSDWVRSVAISPDGRRIVSGSSDNTLRIWVGSPEGWLVLACQRVWFHPLLKQPQVITNDEEKITAAQRARAVCEGVGRAAMAREGSDPAGWVKGLAQQMARLLG